MDIQPDFVLKLSLEEMALRRVVVNFWNATDVLKSIGEFSIKKDFCKKYEVWQKVIEKKVKEKILKLVCPESLKNRMCSVLKPIGLQITEWKKFMEQCLCASQENLDMTLLNFLCWTPAGAVNYERTAEKIAGLRTLDVLKRFVVASEHCLLDSLPVVWEELTEVKRDSLETFCNPSENKFLQYNKFLLQIYWVHVLKGEEYKLLKSECRFYLEALKFSALRSNKAATEYFFQKLSNTDRDSVFSEFEVLLTKFFIKTLKCDFPRENSTDAFCYLLSQITPEKQMHALKDCPAYLFKIFLNWRWQHLFLEKTKLIWSWQYDASTYKNLLCHIGCEVRFSDYYFPEIFQEFIRASPRDFRTHLVNEACLNSFQSSLFSSLLFKQDKETVKVILKILDAEDKVRLVSCPSVFGSFNILLKRKNHYLVEICVREAYPSKEDRKRLKEVFMKFLTEEKINYMTPEWQRFFETLDKIDAIILKKRSLKNETAQS